VNPSCIRSCVLPQLCIWIRSGFPSVLFGCYFSQVYFTKIFSVSGTSDYVNDSSQRLVSPACVAMTAEGQSAGSPSIFWSELAMMPNLMYGMDTSRCWKQVFKARFPASQQSLKVGEFRADGLTYIRCGKNYKSSLLTFVENSRQSFKSWKIHDIRIESLQSLELKFSRSSAVNLEKYIM
jgi:hypothetical protein